MGACCTRQNIIKDETLEFYSNINQEDSSSDLLNYNIYKISKKFDNNNYNIILNNIINKLKEKYSNNEIKKITFNDIYNIVIYYKENYLNSNYLIYDFRNFEERKENYIKKMKQINYSFEEIKNLNNKKKQKFINYITNKDIIFIIKDIENDNNNNDENDDINSDNIIINKIKENNIKNIENKIKKGLSNNNIINISNKNNNNIESDPINFISLLLDFNIKFSISLLNTSFDKKTLTNYSSKLSNFLEENHFYENLPFILLPYSHIDPLKYEGYFFISFNKENLFDFNYFENINNNDMNNNNNDVNKNFIINFINEIKITTIIQIDNLNSNTSFKQFQRGNFLYKEYTLSIKDINESKDNTEMICRWIRKEMILGHSIVLNVKNYKEEEDNENNNNTFKNNDNYIIIVILILCLSIKIKLNKIIEYLKEKVIFIKDFKNKIDFIANNNKNNNENLDILKLIKYYELNNDFENN
jgi:hypothetical protein